MDVNQLKIEAYDISREIGLLEQQAKILQQKLIETNKKIQELEQSNPHNIEVKTKTKLK